MDESLRQNGERATPQVDLLTLLSACTTQGLSSFLLQALCCASHRCQERLATLKEQKPNKQAAVHITMHSVEDAMDKQLDNKLVEYVLSGVEETAQASLLAIPSW